MNSADALPSPSAAQLEDQLQLSVDVAPPQDGSSTASSSTTTGASAVKPRVFKMSDEFLMFKFKVGLKAWEELPQGLQLPTA